MDCFRVIAPKRHAPRISLGSLIIKRESWRFSPEEMQFVYCAGASERFLQARNWARAHRMPRFVFHKVPIEKKPAYLDFDSPIFVDIFSKMIRRTVDAALPSAMIDLSEMLPLFDQNWLTDVSGQRYTSEFRFVAVDSRKPASGSLYEANLGRASSGFHHFAGNSCIKVLPPLRIHRRGAQIV